MTACIGIAVAVSLAGCVPPQAIAPATPIYVSSNATVVANDPSFVPDTDQAPSLPNARILILVDKHIDRPTEVIGVLDFHSKATSGTRASTSCVRAPRRWARTR
jgi:hypothetical protein